MVLSFPGKLEVLEKAIYAPVEIDVGASTQQKGKTMEPEVN
jgi:hypothetical protein